jgi:hypothetical protein
MVLYYKRIQRFGNWMFPPTGERVRNILSWVRYTELVSVTAQVKKKSLGITASKNPAFVTRLVYSQYILELFNSFVTILYIEEYLAFQCGFSSVGCFSWR